VERDAPEGNNTRVHPDLEPLAFLLGTWRGEGSGGFPTIRSFAYGEELAFSLVGEKPYLAYAQRSWLPGDGSPLHAETGFWRPAGEGRIDVALAHPLGLAEIGEGTVSGTTVRLFSAFVARAARGLPVTRYDRRYEVEGDAMTYEQSMATLTVPLAHHVSARLLRL
jgi:hypothetical protein